MSKEKLQAAHDKLMINQSNNLDVYKSYNVEYLLPKLLKLLRKAIEQ